MLLLFFLLLLVLLRLLLDDDRPFRHQVEHEQYILTITDQRRCEEEGRLGLLDDKINSIQQARELQQQRADQQVLAMNDI